MMEIIILAGGIGSRLQSVVNDVPKCMAEVAGKPFLHYLFQYITPFQPKRVILSLGYKHEIVEEWLKELTFPFEIVCKVESSPLGTGGAIKYALSAVEGEEAFVINGDTFFDVDLTEMSRVFQQDEDKEALLALKPMKNFSRYGSVRLDEENRTILSFEEKRFCPDGLINGGIYLIRKNALQRFPERFSMENDYFSERVKERKLAGYSSDGYFIDIGIPEDYARAQEEFKERK